MGAPALCLLLFLAWLPETPAMMGAELETLTARRLFVRLPTTFFDTTDFSLSESEKYALIQNGYAGGWVIRTATPNLLELETLQQGSTVRLCLYRGESNMVAALGTESGPVCLTELWRYSDNGGLAPQDAPPGPFLLDYFQAGKRIPADISLTTTYCAYPEGLEARPQFWSSAGQVRLRPDNAVFYVWTGKRFSKRLVPLVAESPSTLKKPHIPPGPPPTPVAPTHRPFSDGSAPPGF